MASNLAIASTVASLLEKEDTTPPSASSTSAAVPRLGVVWFRSAATLRRSRTMSKCPAWAAMCKGVTCCSAFFVTKGGKVQFRGQNTVQQFSSSLVAVGLSSFQAQTIATRVRSDRTLRGPGLQTFDRFGAQPRVQPPWIEGPRMSKGS